MPELLCPAPHAPRALVNVEMEDSGLIATGRCDCAFTQAGLSTVIHDVASFGEPGHGVILVGTDIVAILEERTRIRIPIGATKVGSSLGRRDVPPRLWELAPMNRLIKRRITWTLGGVVYGAIFTLWLGLGTGGGHARPIVVVFAFYVFSLPLWPLWGFLAVDLSSHKARVLFLWSVAVPYALIFVMLVLSVLNASLWHGSLDLYLTVVITMTPWLAAQFFLWRRLLRAGVGSAS